jgi:hypothetical protein
MELEIIRIKGDSRAKCTIHKSGKLGFSNSAARVMGLSSEKYLLFAKNKTEKEESDLYVFIYGGKAENSLKVIKAGNYFYCNTKVLFEELGIDFKTKTVIYDIREENYKEEKIFKLTRRDIDKKKKN